MPDFYFIVPGWNCAYWVTSCLQSLMRQRNETWFAVFVDDASTDDTPNLLDQYVDEWNNSVILTHEKNRGAAYSRWHALSVITPRDDDVIVLVDMDDWLLHPFVLERLAKKYADGAEVSYGNFKQASGVIPFDNGYPDHVHRKKSYRSAAWRCIPLRTFRYSLFPDIPVHYFQDTNGEWLQSATDMAIMFPVLEQADPKRIHFIDDIFYRYNNQRHHVLARRRKSQSKIVRRKEPFV